MSANSSSVIITPVHPKSWKPRHQLRNSHRSTSSLPRAPSSTRFHLHPEISPFNTKYQSHQISNSSSYIDPSPSWNFCNSTQNYKERVTLSYSWNMFLYSSIWEEADSRVCYFKEVCLKYVDNCTVQRFQNCTVCTKVSTCWSVMETEYLSLALIEAEHETQARHRWQTSCVIWILSSLLFKKYVMLLKPFLSHPALAVLQGPSCHCT